MTYVDMVKKVSSSIEIPEKVVDNTYKAYWRVVKKHLESLPLKEDLNEAEFFSLKTKLNIPSIGKMSIPLGRYKKLKKYTIK